MKLCYRFYYKSRNLNEIGRWAGVDGKIILKWTLNVYCVLNIAGFMQVLALTKKLC
jgi:hypothetical protein